jgi:c-di-GMP-binding flagellar brake protein YcgR
MEMTTDSAAERRRRQRIPVSVELKLHAPDLHFVLLSRTIDMSTQGAFVRSNRPLPVGAEVTVQFERGEARNPLSLKAKVVRVGSTEEGRSSGIALRFSEITDLDEALLKDIISAAKA